MSETELQELDMLEQLRYSMEHDFEGFSRSISRRWRQTAAV